MSNTNVPPCEYIAFLWSKLGMALLGTEDKVVARVGQDDARHLAHCRVPEAYDRVRLSDREEENGWYIREERVGTGRCCKVGSSSGREGGWLACIPLQTVSASPLGRTPQGRLRS